jgi:hypothetical protein
MIVPESLSDIESTMIAIFFMPGLPGNANNVPKEGDAWKPKASACSLPPEPISRIFMVMSE